MIERFQEKAGERVDKAFDRFIDEHPEMSFRSVNVGGKILVLLEKSDLALNDLTLAEDILKKQAQVEKKGIQDGTCFFIAAESVHDKTSDGVLSAHQDAGRLVGYDDHAVNYKNLPDGSVLAVDYTTPKNIDSGRDAFKTLALHALTMEEIKKYLEDLYGGNWYEQSPEQTERIYRNRPKKWPF